MTDFENDYVSSVPRAGKKFFNLGRSASYEAARRGDIPTMWIGRKQFALIAVMKRRLEQGDPEPSTTGDLGTPNDDLNDPIDSAHDPPTDCENDPQEPARHRNSVPRRDDHRQGAAS